MAVPAWEMASRAYSTWYRRPSGEKMVVYMNRLAWWELPGTGASKANVLGNRNVET
jgi:hypothetical protein